MGDKMNLTEINIYTHNKKIISFIEDFLRVDKCTFFSPDEPPEQNANNVYIITEVEMPDKFYENAKYILMTDDPAALNSKQLEFIYDIWPETLTIPLLKFFLGKLIADIQSEIQKEHTENVLLEMAHQDYLTGLATRWYLHEYFQNNEDEENLTCIYFDLDNFKEVNDTYGHQTGDRVLAATAAIMLKDFTDGFVARMGGDEFMVVLSGERSVEEVEAKVIAFMYELSEYYSNIPTMKNLSVSAGIAQKLNGEDKTIDTLINESDTALYDAKKAGKNCCKIYKNS